MNRLLAVVAAGVLSASGCASTGDLFERSDSRHAGSPVDGEPADVSRSGYSRARYGYVETIREIQRDARGNWLPGAVIGGVVGGVLGNQIGGGRGNDVATMAGVLGGAVIGGQVASRSVQGERAFEVTIRLDDGTLAAVRQPDVSDLQPNMRVVVDNGRVRRY